jgi:hypothetical protein
MCRKEKEIVMKRSVLITLVLALALPVAAIARPADTANPPTLVGSWVASVTPTPAVVPPFRELFTFHSDGTLTMIDDNAGGPPFPFTPGHGVWKKSGDTYTFHYLNLIYDPTAFTSNGTANITVKVKLSQDGDSFSGTGHLKVSDNDGNVLFEADGVITGSRITIDEP